MPQSESPSAPHSARTTVRRLPERGHYDRSTIAAILDANFLCHLGLVDPAGYPVVIPTAYGRRGDDLFLHGSAASRLLRTAATGVEVCLTVTLLDGIVLARSVFNHSMNYRSVVVLGRATLLTDDAEKTSALEVITNQIWPGRWEAARRPSPKELKATSVLRLPWSEASAKIRTGEPHDDADDYALPIWAGVVPTQYTFAAPVPDPQLDPAIPLPAHVATRPARPNPS